MAPTTKCPHGIHQWTNQFGDDWSPEQNARCDCGEKQWGWRNAGVPRWCPVCRDIHAPNEPHVGALNRRPDGKAKATTEDRL